MATIDDIPVELLLDVISCVHNSTADASDDSSSLPLYGQTKQINDLKSIRLTCRRFSKLAARPLFTSISCSILDAESLERLEHISRHPHLSQHVKTVHVKLGFYDPVLVEDLASLAKYLLWAWEDFQQPSPDDTEAWEREETTEEAVMRRDLEEWVWRSQHVSRRDRERLLPALHLIKAEYRRRYMAQQDLRKTGDAIRRLGQAMALMPAATSLVLQDARQAHSHLGPLLFSTLKAKADPTALALPLSWTDCARLKEEQGLGEFTPPFDLIIDIPVAVRRAGVRLTELRVVGFQIPDELPAWDAIDPYGWDRHPEDDAAFDLTDSIQLATASDLAAACTDLRLFQFDPQTKLVKDVVQAWMYRFDDRLSRFSNIIERMCHTTNMRRLRLDCLCADYDASNNPDVHYYESLFKSASWPNLESLHIENGRLETAETLLHLVRNLPKLSSLQLDALGLHHFHIGGRPETRWSYLLDEVRKEMPRLRKNGLEQRGWESELPIKIRNAEAVYDEEHIGYMD
ncbi:hypothetical protein PpBr36_02777 [Pyricularia pennisetigena]|uniref:hypothetical protein n=1 Tax=Pyricularia pennisetigena TaxID=1578925 RepID=UPI00114F5442|nr:hypothetical protein PpBr36_02777 [Pyricularia pennisetigena]TLS30722.1 hypothetical protein PpBr36_02777 [Pyricularia pennisetigena]